MLSVIILNVVMLSVIVLNVVMLSVIVPNVVMLSVIVINVVGPENVGNKKNRKNEKKSLNFEMLVANVAKLFSSVI